MGAGALRPLDGMDVRSNVIGQRPRERGPKKGPQIPLEGLKKFGRALEIDWRALAWKELEGLRENLEESD